MDLGHSTVFIKMILLFLLLFSAVEGSVTSSSPPCLNTENEKLCLSSCECVYCENPYYGLHCMVDALSQQNKTDYNCSVLNSCTTTLTTESSSDSGSSKKRVELSILGTIVICILAFFIFCILLLLALKTWKARRFNFYEMVDLSQTDTPV